MRLRNYYLWILTSQKETERGGLIIRLLIEVYNPALPKASNLVKSVDPAINLQEI